METAPSGGIRQLRPPTWRPTATGADPPCPAFLFAAAKPRLGCPDARHGARYTRVLLRTLLRDPCQQGTDLCFPVPTVATQRPDGRQLARFSPTRDGLRVDPEHRCDLRRRQKRLCFWCSCRHVYGLSSWTGTAILRWLPLAPLEARR